MKFPPQCAMYHDDRAVDVADQAVAQENVRNFPVASLSDAWQRADGGDARGFASRLSSEGLVHQLRQFGLALPDGHRRPDPPFRKQRARYLVEVMFATVHESGSDAVDGSSTGTRVPRMWGRLRLP